jgi:ferredoxin-NADP reductase
MAVSVVRTGHDRGYHRLTVARVTHETADTCSFALTIPDELHQAYSYAAGQFLTFRVTIDGRTYYRSYSMSSAPASDDLLAVTVKRVGAGAVSNWMIDSLQPGDEVEASVPAGVFVLRSSGRNVLAFAAGSGITPIFSIVKSALATSGRECRLLYANRDEDSVIFGPELSALATDHPGRLQTDHHLDDASGFVAAADIEGYLPYARDAEVYVCGPAPFMDLVEATLLAGGVAVEQIHIERFTTTEPPAVPANHAAARTQVTIELDGETKTADHHPGATVLQTARQLGMSPPYSCEAGNCATCMAKLVEGEVKMNVNDALFEDEVAEGWILTCQSVPTTPTIHVVYGFEG